MSDLMLPPKGKSAASLLQDLNADHAPDGDKIPETNVTTLQDSLQETNGASAEGTGVTANARTSGGGDRPSATAAYKGGRRGRSQTTDPKNAAQQETTPVAASVPQPVSSERADRYARALEQAAEDEIAVVTVRISGRLNEYMDRYVERMNRLHPKRRYRKQDAVAEAFAAFYADHPMPPAPDEDDL